MTQVDQWSRVPEHARRWNRTRTEYPRSATVPELFWEQARARPGSPALSWDGGEWTYAQLGERTLAGAATLREHGVRPGDVVALELPQGPTAVAAIMAVLHMGAVYLPIAPEQPAPRRRGIVENAHASLAMTEYSRSHPLTDTVGVLEAAPALAGTGEHGAAPAPAPRTPDDPCYVIYTSGSTGRPKGVVCPHRGPVRLVKNTDFLQITPHDRLLATTNLTFDVSCFEVFGALLNGACLVLCSTEELLDSTALEEVLNREAISLMWLSAGLFHQHAHARPHMFASLRCLLAGGDVLAPSAVRAVLHQGPPELFINGYGPTENSSLSTAHRIHSLGEHEETVPIGVPIANSTAYVIRDDGTVADPGETGELWVGGDGVALGYLHDEERTRERFLADRFAPGGGGRLYRTGDLARWRNDGVLEFFGRRDRQVKVRGYRVELDEVETALGDHPQVQEAAVDLVGDEANQRLVAAAVPREASDPDRLSRRLRGHLRDRLPAYMVPARVAVVDRLPFNASGKVDRNGLKELVRSSERGRSRQSGRMGATEQAVAAVWGELLEVPPPGRQDDFFALGGTSLLATRTVAALRERLDLPSGVGRTLISRLVENPTLAGFAAHVADARNAAGPARPAIDFEAEARPPAMTATPPQPPGAPVTPRRPLLTGASGFLGVHLLDRLVRAGVDEVLCLVRADDPEEGRQRLAIRMRRYGLDPEPVLKRAAVVPGDLADPRLGQDEEGWRRLAEEADLILHNGSHVNFAYPYRALAPPNVGGTRSVLELAAHGRVKPVHYISTIAVIVGAGAAGTRYLDEDERPAHPELISLGYPESKWVAERMVARAGDAGLPTAIYRPYEVSGTTGSGVWNTDTMMCALFRTIAELGLAPDMNLPLDLVPVDYTADAITYILTGRVPDGTVYNITNPHDARLPLLVERLKAMGYPVHTVPYEEWVQMLSEVTARHPDHPMAPYVPMFAEPSPNDGVSVKEMYTDGHLPAFGRSNAESALVGSGLHCPPVDAALLDLYLNRFRRTGFLPPPSAR